MRTRIVRSGVLVAALSLVGCGAKSGLLSVDVAADAGPSGGGDAGQLDAASDAPPDTGFPHPTPVHCPSDPPTTTDACGNVGAVCTYRRGKIGPCSDASASDQVVYRCEPDGWLEIARCIDPTACPAMPPAEGSPCDAEGLDCFYSNATCLSGSIAQCESGSWHGVDDCGARPKEGACVLQPTLSGDARVVLDGSGTIADRPALAAAGTQLLASWALTPELGGTETIDFKVVQTAVPSMARPLPFDFVGPFSGDTRPAADFARDRFALAFGSSESASAGGWVAMPVLDGPPSTPQRASFRPSREVDVATTSHAGQTFGWLVHRHPLGDFKSGVGTSAIAIDGDGKPRSEEVLLADEAPHGGGVEPLHHAWAAVSRWRDGFAVVSSIGASGDLLDDTGIDLWLVSDPTSSSLPVPIRLRVGQSLGGDVVAVTGGDVIVAYMPEASGPRAPYALVRVTPDGSIFAIPSADLGVALSPSPPRLAPFEDGFVLVFSAVREADPDFVPGFVSIAVRSATGEAIVDPVLEPAENLSDSSPIALAFSPADRSMHVAWTRRGSPGSGVQILRQRLVCRGRTSEPGE